MSQRSGVHKDMKTGLWAGLLGVAALMGCGNWSNEDILFKLAAPGKETLRLRVPGAEVFEQQAQGQALGAPCEGDEASTITCGTRQMAGFFNALTFALLGIVDQITSNDPSKREQGLRVWGPHYVSDKGFTARFEMRRNRDTGGFNYCLHVAPGNRTGPFADRDVACGTNTDVFTEFFTGSFVPEEGSEAQARRGIGDMTLNLNTQRKLGAADDPSAQGKFIFNYDTRAGRAFIAITVEDFTDQESGLPAQAVYTYQRTDAWDGEMQLVLRKQLRCGPLGCTGSDLEELELGARWTEEGRSRVDAKGTGGDLGGTEYRGWECAEADLTLVARHYDWDPAQDLGMECQCPFTDLPPCN